MNAMIGVRARITLARLMLLTGIRLDRAAPDAAPAGSAAVEPDLVDSAVLPGLLAAVIDAGVELVQLREPGPEGGAGAAFRTAADVVGRHDALLVVGDWTGAAIDPVDAVCLPPASALLPSALPDRPGPYTRLGAVATDRATLQRLLADPRIDFVLVDAGTDLALVRAAAADAPVSAPDSTPWFAVGEFDLPRLEQALQAGARRIAVSRALTRADDPAAVAAGLSGRLAAAWNADPELTRLTFTALADQG